MAVKTSGRHMPDFKQFLLFPFLCLASSAGAQQQALPRPTEQAITITSDGQSLVGVLTGRARGRAQAVALLIPGSGPTDRDGNNPAGVSAAPLRMLANELAQRGIATVRADKRGQFTNRGAAA